MTGFKRDLPELTKDQAIVLSVITGHLLIQPFKHVLEDVQSRIGREVFPQEFLNPEFQHYLADDVYRADLMKLVVTIPELIVIGEQ